MSAELRAIALAATPGPWEADAGIGHLSYPEHEVLGPVARVDGGVKQPVICGVWGDESRDAEFIATFDPPTVLSLLDKADRVDAAERERDEWKATARSTRTELLMSLAQVEVAEYELAELHAGIEALANSWAAFPGDERDRNRIAVLRDLPEVSP